MWDAGRRKTLHVSYLHYYNYICYSDATRKKINDSSNKFKNVYKLIKNIFLVRIESFIFVWVLADVNILIKSIFSKIKTYFPMKYVTRIVKTKSNFLKACVRFFWDKLHWKVYASSFGTENASLKNLHQTKGQTRG